MHTELKPYKHTDYSPHSWPPQVGQLVILLDEPRGYVGVLESVTDTPHGRTGQIKLLDSTTQDRLHCPLTSLLPTGKTPEDLVGLYEPTDTEFAQALAREREFPVFKAQTKRKHGSGRKKKTLKDLTPDQKEFLVRMIKEKLAQGGQKDETGPE